MKKISVSGRLVLGLLAVLAVTTFAQAALQLYESNNVRYLGHWTWNDADSNSSTVEVLMKAAPPRKQEQQRAVPQVCIQNFKVEVAALAEDGSFVQRSKVLQLQLGATRKVQLEFDRTLTSLQFIKLLSLPGGGNCANP